MQILLDFLARYILLILLFHDMCCNIIRYLNTLFMIRFDCICFLKIFEEQERNDFTYKVGKQWNIF